MANVKITDLTAYTDPVSTDVLPIVDVGADVTKKVSIADLLKNASAGTAAAPGIAFDGDNTGIYSPGADQVAISTGGTGRLFIDASGNVGIGTTSPSEKLELGSGNIKLSTIGRIFSTDGSRGSIQISAPNDGTSRRVTYGNNYYLDSDLTYKQDSAVIGGCALELSALNAGYGTLKFIQKQDPDSGGATRDALVIDENGNVGIGSSSPQSELTVRGSNPQITLEPTNDTTQSCRIEFALTDGTVQSRITGGGSQGSEIRFSQGPTERVRITSDGKLGLGTSSPENKLHIVGTSATTNTGATILVDDSASLAADIGGSIAFRGTDGSTSRTYGLIRGGKSNAGAGGFDGYLAFETRTNGEANTTERLRITNTGNVGIGTTSPSSLLHLADAGDITVGTTTGTKIGTATSQKIGFYNATPVVQPTAVADITTTATSGSLPTPDGSVTIADAATPTVTELLKYCVELEAKLEAALGHLRTLGLIAT